MAKCSKCGIEKPRSDFYRMRKNSAAYHASCKECLKERNHHLAVEVRLEVLHYYGGTPPSCACCNEQRIEFLVIDHIHGGGNRHRREVGMNSSTHFYFWLRRNGFPSGFQVLCHNCNFARTRYGCCPHSVEYKEVYHRQ